MFRRYFTCVAAVGLLVRWWQWGGNGWIWWGDSQDYLDVSRASTTSLDFWAGTRPFAVPLLLKVLGEDLQRFVYVQAAIATLCWAALAASVTTLFDRTRDRVIAAVMVAGLSLTVPVQMWEASILSESLAVSALVLVVAAGLQVAREATWPRVILLIAALVLFLATRDTNTVVLALGGVALGAWVVFGRPQHEWRLAVVVAVIMVFGGLASVAATEGQRYSFPLRNVLVTRVLPYPDRTEWFTDHGMPHLDVEMAVAEPGGTRFARVPVGDPAAREWENWVIEDGRSTFMVWMATHPVYVLTEPWVEPERTFNNAEGDLSFYARPDMRSLPLISNVLWPPRWLALLVGAGAVVWVIRRGRWCQLLFVAGSVTLVLAGIHAMISWHSDGMETARHLVVPTAQFHIGLLLVLLGALRAHTDDLAGHVVRVVAGEEGDDRGDLPNLRGSTESLP